MPKAAMIKAPRCCAVHRSFGFRICFCFLLSTFRLSPFPFWQERFAERLVKIVAGLEVVASVGLGFAEQPGVHHVEDEFAEIFAAMDAPFIEDGCGHRTELLESKLANAVEQLAAADVARGGGFLAALALAGLGLLRVIERLAQEMIRAARVALVSGANLLEYFAQV